MLRVLSLFAGIGGFDLGLERTGGFQSVAFCEINQYCQRVLAKHWPGVPCYDDVREITAKRLTDDGITVDVICAGFPCQDISYAGAGAGLAGSRSGLFWEVVRAVRVVRPEYVILENVAALLSRGLDTVLGALAEIGYDAEWHCIPASAVGAPHRRDRIWIIAHARGEQHEGSRPPLSGTLAEELSRAVADTSLSDRIDAEADALGPNADSFGSHRAQEHFFGGVEFRDEQIGQPGSLGEDVANTGRVDVQRFVPCISDEKEREGSLERQAGPRNAGIGGFWAVEPSVGRVAHGVPARVDRLKALGNAVVPQVVEMIGRAILAAHARQAA